LCIAVTSHVAYRLFVSVAHVSLIDVKLPSKKIIAVVQFEIKVFDSFYQARQLTDYIYTDIYYKLSKCIGQTLCSCEH